jgi:tetratricopeptide (TPR) repeat protein
MQAAPRDPYELGLSLSAQARHAEAIGAFEKALYERPDDVRVLFALGNTARILGLPKPAEAFFRRVLEFEPARLEAIVNLANLLRAEGQHLAALAIVEPALSRNPDAAELWLTLGSIHRELGNRDRAMALYRAALARDPDCAPALGNLADLLADDGDVAEAMVLYDRAVQREPKNAQLRLNRAVLHLLRGELKKGWRDYAARLGVPGKAPVCGHGLKPWSGSHLKNTRLLITAEQGVGDQIMFASLIPELASRAHDDGGAILLECEPRLVSLFDRSFPSVSVFAAHMETRGGVTDSHYPWLKQAGGANAAIEMGSLPRYLRRAIEAFPKPHTYLKPDAAEASAWQSALAQEGAAPYTGICWRSGKTGGLRSLQFAPLAAWAELLRELPGTIVSLQYDAIPSEIAELEALSGRKIFVAPGLDQKRELDRTCALISVLDYAVSAPTAVSWLAAGAGIPTFKVLYDTSWTSFGTNYEPFAPSGICVMPKTRGDWGDVFRQVSGLIGSGATHSN